MRTTGSGIFIVLFVTLWLFQGWLFLFAPCATVKEFWWIGYVPGRCIKL